MFLGNKVSDMQMEILVAGSTIMWLAVITGITLVVALDLNVANLLFTCHKGLGLHWQLMLMHLPKAPLL
jgi:hypothetical protein